MELCNITTAATTTTSTLPLSLLHRHHKHLSTSTKTHLCFNTSLHRSSITRSVPDSRSLIGPLLRAASSKDYSGRTRCYNEDRAAVTTIEDGLKLEKTVHVETAQTDISEDESPVDVQSQGLDLLDKLNIQVESADTSSILLFGGGALVSLWFTAAIVGAIDSIPIFPKLMEVIGLAYTFWFSTRYLIFKKNRDELVKKIDEIKLQVLGSIEE